MTSVNPATGGPVGVFIPAAQSYWAYATLALGSAMALFMYPHSITATLSSRSRNTIRHNATILPAYSFVLGLLALLGWVAIAAGTKPIGLDGKPNAQLVIPQLFEDYFPAWFAGVAFAAVAIGALVPAAIMSIAAANTFTRNIYKEWIKPHATHADEANVSKIVSLVVKGFALVFVLTLDKQNAINFQLLGGIWILQTFPSIVFGLYTRWFHGWGLLAGWAAGMIYGTVTAYNVVSPITGNHFAGSVAMIPVIGELGYIALTAFTLNAIVAAAVTAILAAVKVPHGRDETTAQDYLADEGDPRAEKRIEHTLPSI
jgi:SSS family solute:Na+ symporter